MLSQNPFLQNLSPGVKVLFFFFGMLIFGSLISITLITVVGLLYGISYEEIMPIFSGEPHDKSLEILRWGAVLNQVGGFLIISLLFRKVYGNDSIEGFYLKKPPVWAWLAPLAIILSLPLVEVSLMINETLIPVDSYLQTSDSIKEMTANLLQMDSPLTLILNLIILALLPAICEELAFRGVIQNQIAKATGRMHTSVWLTAIVFSAYHMQLDYFLPRLILGALLGYILVHTGSILASMLAHFANNAIVIFTAYFSKAATEMDPTTEFFTNPITAVGLTLALAALIYFTLPKSMWPKISEKYMFWEPKPLISNEE